MSGSSRQRWYRRAVEPAVVVALLLALSLYALWRMDYLSADTAHQIRMTDSSRTAYVAKNIIEGKGYTSNELPAFLLNFYDDRGKLHDERWVNSDRFPFTAYAVAALYGATGSSSVEVGILTYNLICFVAFLALLYWMTRSIWNDRWSALFALTIALIHPLTYNYLYLKDGDMMLLSAGVMFCLYRYFEAVTWLSWRRGILLGTLLGWLYLCRPNIGGAFVLYFVLVVLRRLWIAFRAKRLRDEIVQALRREGVVFAVAALWLLPFVIHSMSEWGEPMFTGNAMYQRPLGTRFAMDTDTWWKYSDPSHVVTLDTLRAGASNELVAKFTSSWLVTLKTTVATWAGELFLTFGLLAWLTKRRDSTATEAPTHPDRDRPVRRLGGVVLFAVALNLAVLPLYGAQNYGYRHYLSFFLPFLWLCTGRAIALVFERIQPIWASAVERVRAKPGHWLALLVILLLVWNFGTKAQEANQLFVVTSRFVARHWLSAVILLAVLAWPRVLFRGSSYTRAVILMTLLVFARWVPRTELKMLNLYWFPADERVWSELRRGEGLVVSLAMQGEVNWATDRKNIPAPENVLHVYSLLGDHRLEVGDLYLESAEAMVGFNGVFHYAAPGFESYARMERFQGRLPGYEVAFHAATVKGYPKYNVKPIAKSSTIWRLTDRDAVKVAMRSPERLELGKVETVANSTFGWGDYFMIDGRAVVAATDETYMRYRQSSLNRPIEDSAMSFFLDERHPTSVEVQLYATHATTLDFYWNLDLYAYDRPADRASHRVGSHTTTTTGWQTVRLTVPAALARTGINKLGFDATTFEPATVCPQGAADEACAGMTPPLLPLPGAPPEPVRPAHVVRSSTATSPATMNVSVFVEWVTFDYR
jgi:hypothetical protein